jgi:hypothetical protein
MLQENYSHLYCNHEKIFTGPSQPLYFQIHAYQTHIDLHKSKTKDTVHSNMRKYKKSCYLLLLLVK